MRTDITAQSDSRENFPAGKPTVKVLLVSDWSENLARLKSLLRLSRYEVTDVQTGEELYRACQDFYDVVVMDVGPEHLGYALQEIRASAQMQDTPVLVRAERLVQAFETTSVFAKQRALPELDSERLAQDFVLTSLFTKYRALPGLDAELARLVSARGREKGRLPRTGRNELSENTGTL